MSKVATRGSFMGCMDDISVALMDYKSDGALGRVVDGLDITTGDKRNLKRLLVHAVSATRKASTRYFDPELPKLPQPGLFVDAFRDAAIATDSCFIFPESLNQLSKRIDDGENFLFVANHLAPADSLAMLKLISLLGPRLAQAAVFISSVPPSPDLFRDTLMNGVNRHQVYSDERMRERPEDVEALSGYNRKSLLSLGRKIARGGSVLVIYPQGAVFPKGLTKPPGSSQQIIDLFSRQSRRGYGIIPVALQGTEQFLSKLSQISDGTVSLKTVKLNVEAAEPTKETSLEQLMVSIARMLPDGQRGPY